MRVDPYRHPNAGAPTTIAYGPFPTRWVLVGPMLLLVLIGLAMPIGDDFDVHVTTCSQASGTCVVRRAGLVHAGEEVARFAITDVTGVRFYRTIGKGAHDVLDVSLRTGPTVVLATSGDAVASESATRLFFSSFTHPPELIVANGRHWSVFVGTFFLGLLGGVPSAFALRQRARFRIENDPQTRSLVITRRFLGWSFERREFSTDGVSAIELGTRTDGLANKGETGPSAMLYRVSLVFADGRAQTLTDGYYAGAALHDAIVAQLKMALAISG